MDSRHYFRSLFSKVVCLLALSFFSCNFSKKTTLDVNLPGSKFYTGKGDSIDSICGLDKNYLISKFGVPVSSDTFLLNSGVTEFSIELYNIFRPEYLKTHKVYIDESTWNIDSVNNFTVWYKVENDKLLPVDTCLWSIDLEF